jgi:Leucine-rich repeat (LRR) protein
MTKYTQILLALILITFLSFSCDDEDSDTAKKTEIPIISNDNLILHIGQIVQINGEHFGNEKLENYKLMIDGQEHATLSWNDSLIEFEVPNDINKYGTIQIDKNGSFSQRISYNEGVYYCEIDGIVYNSNTDSIQIINSELKEISECLGNLQKLEYLYLSTNITDLPDEICDLQNLSLLALQNNLTSLPENFGNLKNLSFLALNEWKLKRLPDSFIKLQNLDSFNLFQEKPLANLKIIGGLINLKYFHLWKMKLTELPESFWELTNLEELRLWEIDFKSLPESIGNLTNLRYLSLGDNKLVSIPEGIGNLKNLEQLWLEDNNLTSLPESIKNLKDNLKHLHLGWNDFSEEEKEKIESWLPYTNIRWTFPASANKNPLKRPHLRFRKEFE